MIEMLSESKKSTCILKKFVYQQKISENKHRLNDSTAFFS